MTKTNTTKTLRGAALKAVRALCAHTHTIELADGTEVCVTCEAVIPPASTVHGRRF